MIYFIQAGIGGPIKIGYTDKDAADRLRSLQTGNPEKLTLIGTIEGSVDDEATFHRVFGTYRLNGEWFRPDANLLVCLAKIATNRTPFDRLPSSVTPVADEQHTTLKTRIDSVEKQTIAGHLAAHGGNVTKTAEQLGLSRKGLQLKMIRLGIRPSASRM